jgi:hypothetical protein
MTIQHDHKTPARAALKDAADRAIHADELGAGRSPGSPE